MVPTYIILWLSSIAINKLVLEKLKLKTEVTWIERFKLHVDSDCTNLHPTPYSGSSGSVSFTDLAPGRYVLRVAATNNKEDRAIERRRFEISSDPSFCTTQLINGGVTVRGKTAAVEFVGTGPAEMFSCRLDTEPAFACMHRMHLVTYYDQMINSLVKSIMQSIPSSSADCLFLF